MNLKDKIAVMQAFDRGEKVEYRLKHYFNEWSPAAFPVWNWDGYKYRIAPKSRYLPVYDIPRPVAWFSTKEDACINKSLGGFIGYLEDKQDGSPYIFHQL